MKATHRVIAIDGPAASGKSSVARELAYRLGFVYVNSGAMYRAMTWHALQSRIDPRDSNSVASCAERARIVRDLKSGEMRILINGIDSSSHLRDDAVSKSVSLVSSVQRVRTIL